MPRSLVLAVLVVLALTGCTGGDDIEDQVRSVVQDYVAAWSAGEYDAAGALTDDAAATEALLTATAEQLGVPGPEASVGTITVSETGAEVAADVTWALPALPEWAYDLTLTLARPADGEDWTIRAGPDTVHPSLREGQELLLARTLPERASILDESGAPLFTATPIVTVGVDPGEVTDLPTLAATLADVLQIDGAQVVTDVEAAADGQFVPVITLRRVEYDAVRNQIRDLPGTVFREATRQLAPTAQFASAVLGRVGPVTAEVLEESPGLLAAGQEAGLSGLQRVYQEQLTGTPGLTISTAEAGVPVDQLSSVEPVAGEALQTTLSVSVQSAADEAVDALAAPAYVVAVRASTGEILAVSANAAANPANALIGQFPAGSTFKIVTAAAVLEAGLAEPGTIVPCPASTTVEGREFENQDRFVLGDVSFTTAFARSCNSTFTALGTQLPPSALPESAAQFGIGSDWTLPIDTITGSVPPPEAPVVQAADSIGQGDVLVSPFAMALVSATVAAGAPPVPVLVPSADPAGTAPPGPSQAVIDALRSMTREVVTAGTATALGDLPGAVAGKTGTAEYGTGDPPPAHAWFAGYRGDLAFAVFVEGGQSSATTAVPVTASFLALLPPA